MLETAVQCQAIHCQNCLLLKAVLLAVLQLSFRKTILDLCLRVQTKSGAAVDIFSKRGSFNRPLCSLDKEVFGLRITPLTEKEIQAGNEARIIAQNKRRSTT